MRTEKEAEGQVHGSEGAKGKGEAEVGSLGGVGERSEDGDGSGGCVEGFLRARWEVCHCSLSERWPAVRRAPGGDGAIGKAGVRSATAALVAACGSGCWS